MPVQSQAPSKMSASPSQSQPNPPDSETKKPFSLFDAIPLKLVLTLASPYIAGEHSEQAISIAHKLGRESGFSGTLDILGEDARSDEECERNVQGYLHLVDMVAQSKLPPTAKGPRAGLSISFKPSMFSSQAPSSSGLHSAGCLDDAFDRISRIVDYGAKHSVRMTLEAEDHRWTDFHIEAYVALVQAGYTNVGTVLQTRLFRTQTDIKRFDERMRTRLVIGIYNESDKIAVTRKPEMKELLVRYAGRLLEQGTYVELATHDTDCLDRFFRQVAIAQQVPATRFETQFLQGVPRQKFQKEISSGKYFERYLTQASAVDRAYIETLIKSGVLVRMYLPYGKDAIAGPYCRRRLKENPNMVTYGIKNLLGIQ